jgi:putative PIN family toxin of toxin-antitoxin system
MRVVVDTNIFISFLLGDFPEKLIGLIQTNRAQLLISSQLFEELLLVLGRPKFRRLFSPEDVKTLLALLETKARWVFPSIQVDDCRDKKDNMILECAIEGRADLVVTGDNDLFALHPFHGVRIVSLAEFIGIIGRI